MGATLKSRQRILVVEDDESMAEFISTVLVHDGYRVASAHTVEVGLIDFRNVAYNLVIMDLFMDGMGGIEGISRLVEMNKKVPIIAISAGYKNMTPNEALAAAKKVGATAVLPKPIEAKALIEIVTGALDKKNSAAKSSRRPGRFIQNMRGIY